MHPFSSPNSQAECAKELTEAIRGAAKIAEALVNRQPEDIAVPAPPWDIEQMRAELPLSLADGQGHSLAQVLSDLEKIAMSTPPTYGPNFFNQLFAGHEPAGVAGELLTPVLNTAMHTLKVAGPMILVEQEVVDKAKRAVGYPERDSDGTLVPGGSISNLCAMQCARDKAYPECRRGGFFSGQGALPAPVVYTSEESHYSVDKNSSILGLGSDNVRHVPVDAKGRMRPEALAEAIDEDVKAGKRPVCVVATSGTTVLGAFDELDLLADVCGPRGVWLHADGCLGGSMVLHPERKRLVRGIERCDSVTWNAHKPLGVPLSCSLLLVRERGALARSLDFKASYLFMGDVDELEHNPGRMNIQCARRNDALKLWAAFRHLGDDGLAERIDKQLLLVRHAVGIVNGDPDFELVLDEPQCFNVCFVTPGVAPADLCERLRAGHRVLVGHATAFGKAHVRAVFCNPALDVAAVDRFFAAVREVYEKFVQNDAQ